MKKLITLALLTTLSFQSLAYRSYSDPVTRAYRRAERDNRTYHKMAENPVFKVTEQGRKNIGGLLIVGGSCVVLLGVGSIIRIKMKENQKKSV